MKRIEAYIKTHRLEEVIRRLHVIEGLTRSDGHDHSGHSKDDGHGH